MIIDKIGGDRSPKSARNQTQTSGLTSNANGTTANKPIYIKELFSS